MTIRTIYLHIGRGKTGTTSIQRYLAQKRDTLLQQGVHYIRAGDVNNGLGHQDFAKSFIAEPPRHMISPENPEDVRQAIRSEIVASASPVFLMSSENFILGSPYRIRDYFHGTSPEMEIKIIFFARSQDEVAESEYNQILKVKNETCSFDEYINTQLAGIDYQADIADWVECFGHDKIICRIFDASRNDIVTQFLACIPDIDPNGLPTVSESTAEGKTNAALGFKALTAIRLVNGTNSESMPQLRREIARAFQGSDIPALLFDSDQARSFRARFASSNLAFTKRYIGEGTADLGGRRFSDEERDAIRQRVRDLRLTGSSNSPSSAGTSGPVASAPSQNARLPNNGPMQMFKALVSRLPVVRDKFPSVEFRLPISPTDTDMRMVRIFMESIQVFGGPLAKRGRFVCSVGADEEPFDLKAKYEWTRERPIDFHWVDRNTFRKWTYDATGFDRHHIESDADVVAFVDADLLVAGDFDDILRQAHQTQTMLGFIAHVSPFGFQRFRGTTSQDWWRRIYEAAGLAMPALTFEHTGWGLDWDAIFGDKPSPILSNDPDHRYCPPYFNYGVVVAPRSLFERVGETFVDDLERVGTVLSTPYGSQIANCIAIERHAIPCETIHLNYNFPMNLPGDEIRRLHPHPQGMDSYEDVRIFHYIGQRKKFSSVEALQELMDSTDLTGAWPMFQKRLRAVIDRIDIK
ncbi:hypothetical protein C8N35_11263 [Breoghania corrubedonensis]|uniref:Uncharacterized protein n=1 Tax=Breoghania corrubedonensis TaxID=665038 RepID=A0A2T5UW55_9HYPH|nr:hypothetical protein [Breoghania corrubedonensis]PTW55738.1 hypothetical protein C8N35_11263 [Breoghania corrubedonensis]